MEPRWGVAGPGKACGGARAKAALLAARDHALEDRVVTGEAYGGRKAVGGGSVGRLSGQVRSQGWGGGRGRWEGGEGEPVLSGGRGR